jgi:excisionase family DNA binding protein
MKRLTTKEAARMMECGEQQIRMMIQLEKIPGAFCYGPKYRRTYFITDTQIEKLKKGE